jgi:threonine aldolase
VAACYELRRFTKIKKVCVAKLNFHLDGARMERLLLKQKQDPKDFWKIFYYHFCLLVQGFEA